MADFAVINQLAQENESKIVLLVMDGLGGLPMAPGGPTELEAAFTPNLDRLASEGACGLSTPIGPGISPGSGPAHLALFGYDALKYRIGRGVLEALGIGFDLHPEDVAARGNFCTVDKNGLITDRRAGRIPTEECARLSRKLQQNTNLAKHGVEIFVRPIKEHRFLFVMRGEQLSSALSETDPLQTGKPSGSDLSRGNVPNRRSGRRALQSALHCHATRWGPRTAWGPDARNELSVRLALSDRL